VDAGFTSRSDTMSAVFKRLLIGAVAVLLPLTAAGHGAQFLLAKLEVFTDPVRVRLEVTADFADNPLIDGMEEAEAALLELFMVATRDADGEMLAARPWAQMVPLTLETREQLDPTIPLPPDPTWADRPHELLTAIWEWPVAGAREMRLTVPQDTELDTLLWFAQPPGSDTPVKWKILISGDHSGWIALPEEARLPAAKKRPWLLLLLLLPPLSLWLRRRSLMARVRRGTQSFPLF